MIGKWTKERLVVFVVSRCSTSKEISAVAGELVVAAFKKAMEEKK